MNRIKTREIFKNWNRYLLSESTSGRVIKMIDKLESLGSKIIIKEEGSHTIFIRYESGNKNKLTGSIRCHSTKWTMNGSQNLLGIGQGENNSTWYIALTANTTEGMGPLLYEVLMEYISHVGIKNSALKPDASSVSAAARAVWGKFDKRPDIRKIQLDVDIDTINQRRGDNIEQITADNIRDDTRQFSAIYDKGSDDWSSSSLSRAYRKDNHDLITSLVHRKLIVMPDYTYKLFDNDRFGEVEDGEGWGDI